MPGVLHLGWVPDGDGGYRGLLAVLVRPDGPLGSSYLALVRPFRRLIVYPMLARETARAWRRPGTRAGPAPVAQ